MSSPEADELKRGNLLQLVRSLELIDSLVAEAVQDALWYQDKHSDDIKLSASKEDIKRLQDTHDIYRDGYTMGDMLRYLAGIRDNQRLFDSLIASLIKVMDRTVGSERGQWLDWYERTQQAGDLSWRKAIPASKTIGSADTINALTDKYASIDRVLDLLKGHLSIGGERPRFSDEHRDMLFAIISLSQARGPYAPLDMDEINVVKSEIRRRRRIESQQDHEPRPAARPLVEEADIPAEQGTSTPEPADSLHEVQKWSSAVTATVAILFAVILAAIPGYKAWQYSPRQPGTISDADFWFLVQGSMMQIIGLLTIVLPLALSGRLMIQQWFWTWLLFGVSFLCSIAPIPVYLYFPTEWSATIAFLGSAAQAFVTLQALFGVHKQKTQ